MSKDQKQTITIPVETVDKWIKTLSYIMTTIEYWRDEEKWPINLCYNGLQELSNQMLKVIHSKDENVSLSHIIDK